MSTISLFEWVDNDGDDDDDYDGLLFISVPVALRKGARDELIHTEDTDRVGGQKQNGRNNERELLQKLRGAIETMTMSSWNCH